jgi:predicted Kef-type K+ transport protein
MDTNAIPFRDLAYVIIAAITGGLLAWRLRLTLIIGYVLAGIAISPLTPGPSVSDAHSDEQRRRLALKGKILGRKIIKQMATIVTVENNR